MTTHAQVDLWALLCLTKSVNIKKLEFGMRRRGYAIVNKTVEKLSTRGATGHE